MNEQVRNFLAAQYPYDQLSRGELEELIGAVKTLSVKPGAPVYRFNDTLKGLYIVLEGIIEVRDALGDPISRLGRGNSFGERGLMADGQAVTSAISVEKSRLILIPGENFRALRSSSRSVAAFFDRQRSVRRKKSEPSDFANQPISEVLSAPVITIGADASIREAAKLMAKKHISSLVVTGNPAGKGGGGANSSRSQSAARANILGLFTLRDIVYKSLANGGAEGKVADIMARDPICIGADALAADALLKMLDHNIGHLPVIENDRLVGIVTQSNLILRSANTVLATILEISRAGELDAMKLAASKLPRLLAQMVGAGVDAPIVMRFITDIADALTRRLVALYEAKHGSAPVPYLFAACGSQGRQEQTGVSDQDNCIILDDGVKKGDMAWFEGLAKTISDALNDIGYFYCPGDMMATNPRWLQPLKVWREYFTGWINSPTGEAQMLASVMFDLRGIAGEVSLLEELRADVLEAASGNSIFLAFLTSNSLEHQPPLSLFRGISTIRDEEHRNTIDMKHNGVVPITDLARIYAIKGQVTEVNTRARLVGAMEAGVLSKSGGDDLVAAYDFISEARLRHQASQIRMGRAPDNYMKPSRLSDLERSHLRDAFVVVKSVQSALAHRSMP